MKEETNTPMTGDEYFSAAIWIKKHHLKKIFECAQALAGLKEILLSDINHSAFEVGNIMKPIISRVLDALEPYQDHM